MLNYNVFRFLKEKSGNVAVITALAILPILVLATGGLDLGRQVNMKQEVLQVADAAALHAASQAYSIAKQSGVVEADEIKRIALNSFREQLEYRSLDIEAADAQVNIADDGRFEIKLDYEVAFEPISMAHSDKLRVSGSSTTAGKFGKETVFMDINLMLDYSASMNTGATIEDQVKMWQNPEIGCAFACHRGMNDKARESGIRLRVDAVLDAIDVMLSSAENAIEELDLDTEAAQFSLFTYTNGRLTSRKNNETNIDTLRREVLRLPNYPSGRSVMYLPIRQMASRLSTSGSGRAADDRKNFVFMVTDGVSRTGPRNYIGWAGGGILSSDCKRIKDTGATLAVIYTKYENYADSFTEAFDNPNTRNQTPYNKHEWNRRTWRNHFNGGFNRRGDGLQTIKSSLQACASQGFFFETSNSQELKDAMVDFFDKAIEETKESVRVVS